MLKFINENDFLKVDTFKENEDGSVSWVYDEGEGLPTHSGILYEGFKRFTQEQQGTEEVVVGVDEEGNDITEEQPTYVDVEIDVWGKLWELHNDDSIEITVIPVDLTLVKESAKQLVNSQRDSFISGGVVHNGHTFQTDATSVMDIMGAVMAGEDTQWLTTDNETVTMSASDMQALGGAVASHKKTLVYKARLHKDNIESLTTKADIDDYMINLSWD